MSAEVISGRILCITGSERTVPAIVATLMLLALLSSLDAHASGSTCFRVYDATLYSGKPDLTSFGIQHLKLVEPQRWWIVAKATPDQRRDVVIREAAALIDNKDPIILDMELPLANTDPTSADNIKLYQDVIDWMHGAGYDKPLAYYASLPIRDYWRALRGTGSAPYRDWQVDNDRLAGIVGEVNALYPSLYTFYPDQDGWARYAAANIAEAKRIGGGRPIYPFIWPQYHNSAHDLAYQYIDPAYWMRQLKTVGALADGLVIWGGWDFLKNQQQAWDPMAPWWQETQAYLRSRSDLCRPG